MDNNFNNQNPQNFGAQPLPQNYPNPTPTPAPAPTPINTNAYPSGSPMDFNNVYGNTTVQPVTPTPTSTGAKNPSSKSKLPFILGGLALGAVAIVCVILLLFSPSKKYLGDWGCYNYSTYADTNDTPTTRLILKKDGSFMYGDYKDITNNHYASTYTAKQLDKKSTKGEVYYQINFAPTTEYIDGGVKQDTTGKQMDTLEMSITEEKGQKVTTMMFVNLGNIYYCTAK